jgi:tmRNA-binding protein
MVSIRKIAVALTIVVMSTISFAQAQTWNEWLRQKKTQKKYLLEQIAALQMYMGYAKKGYDIVGSGLHTIRDISNGEFSLHNSFISSLKAVNPLVRKSTKVADIIAMQIEISRAFKSNGKNSLLPVSSQLYITEVKETVMGECWNDLEELLLIITSGRIEMSDDERLERLDRIYLAMLDKSAFAQNFTAEVDMLVLQQKSELSSIERIRRFYEDH